MQVLWERRQWIFVLILTGSFLSGCIGTTPVTPKFYVLTPTQYETSLVNTGEQTGSQTSKMVSLEIISLDLPQYLEKPQIMTRTSRNQLEMAEYHQWGGNLRKNMIRVIVQNMSRLLSTPHVAMPPLRSSAPPDFRIEVEVMRFEADQTGQVMFSAQWRLFRGKERDALATQMIDLESLAPDSPLNMELMVSAMADVLGDFCLVMGKEILTHIPGPASP
jgi:uncharacterized lipoprotein YmbA